MNVPLIFSFWFMVAAYVIHVIDESLLGGSFVEKVQQHWWPEYSWTKFFWFNTGYFVVMISSVVLYDFRGGNWLILPLAWSIERFCNSLWHIWWAMHFREYSPGLVSSILMWMTVYFIVRCRPIDEPIAPGKLWPALVIGLLFTTFLAIFFPLVKARRMHKDSRISPHRQPVEFQTRRESRHNPSV
jgi:Protein of unknown function with HXXEE motif